MYLDSLKNVYFFSPADQNSLFGSSLANKYVFTHFIKVGITFPQGWHNSAALVFYGKPVFAHYFGRFMTSEMDQSSLWRHVGGEGGDGTRGFLGMWVLEEEEEMSWLCFQLFSKC